MQRRLTGYAEVLTTSAKASLFGDFPDERLRCGLEAGPDELPIEDFKVMLRFRFNCVILVD